MSVSSINNISNYISLPTRAERIATIDNRIADNNRQIANLENQIVAQQEVSTTLKEMIINNNNCINITENIISNNYNSIGIIKDIIGNNEKIISLKEKQITNNNENISIIKEIIGNNEKQIANNNENIGIIKEIIGNNEKIISNNNKSIEFLQETQVIAKEAQAIGESRLKNLQETQVLAKESRDLTKESRDLTKESRDLWIGYKNLLQKKYDSNIELINHLQEDKAIDLKIIDCYEKILAIVMKNPSKYEGMSLKDFSEAPEVADTKNNLNEIVEIKVKDYPQKHRDDLINVASKVIDHSLEKKSLVNLEQKIDLAFSKEILAKINRFDKSSVNIYRTNQNLYNEHYFTNIKKYSF